MTRARTAREMMLMEMVQDYTGYSRAVIMGAYRRGELKGERPGSSPKSRLYFDRVEVERWLDSIAEGGAE
jgi:hypothetical protein